MDVSFAFTYYEAFVILLSTNDVRLFKVQKAIVSFP